MALRNWLSLTILLPGFLSGAQHSQTTRTSNPNASLAKPVEWQSSTYRLFKDDDSKITATLATSWISGEKHEGMFRYRMAIFPAFVGAIESQQHPERLTPEWREKFLSRVDACDFFLQLYDVDQFKLRTIPIILQQGVDDQARLQALNTNSDAQMDADEYRSLVGSTTTSGAWSLSWTCPTQP